MKSLDTKLFLRKKKFWIALASVLVIIVMIFVDLNRSQEYDHWDVMQMQQTDNITYQFEEDYEEYAESVQKIGKHLQKCIKKEDWRGANRSVSDLYLIQAYNTLMLSKNENTDLYYHDFFRGKEEVIALVKERQLPVIDEEMADDVLSENMGAPFNFNFPYYRLQAEYYRILGDKDIDGLVYNTIDSSTIIVQFMQLLFPLLPMLIIAFMCYDGVQEDKDSGVIKVLLSQPMKRSRYLRNKILMHLKYVSLIFLLPLLLMSLCYGAFDHYRTLDAPVLSNVQGISSLQIEDNTLATIKNGRGGVGMIGITTYYPIPATTMSPNPELDYLKMWQFVLLCLIMAFLVLVFFVLLTTFMTVLVKNKITALVVSIIIMLAGLFVANPANTSLLYACLPITYMNPFNILSGYSSYSYLTGILVLVGSNLILYAGTMQLFKHKDVL